MKPLKLIALDSEDLDIVSAHVQDAVARVGDIAWLPAEKRFVLILNRFCWDIATGERRRDADCNFQRRRAALHFERVEAVRQRNIRQQAGDAVLNLLAIRFVPGEAPGGAIELIFSSDACVRLEVECIETRLADLGPAWSTEKKPEHALEESGGTA